MRICRTALSLLLLLAAGGWGQSAFAPYAARTEFLLTSPGSMGPGLLGYANPALLNYVERPEAVFAWSDAATGLCLANQWGLFTGLPHLGFGVVHQEQAGHGLSEYRLSLSGGDRRTGLGLGYGWARGSVRRFGRREHLILGGLLRPSPHLSAGLVLTTALSGSAREAAVDLAARPPGAERLTLFADYAVASREAGDETAWSAGAVLELLPGVRLTGRYFDNRTVSFGLHLGLGGFGFQTQSRFDQDRDHTFNTYFLRFGAHEPSAVVRLFRPEGRYLDLELCGPVRHRRFALFDRARTLTDLLTLIHRARRDPDIGGIAVNLSGLRLDLAMAWELRTLLQAFKDAGKSVVIYVDRAGLRAYHLASVADHLVLDPAGMIVLQGFVGGQTYFKGTLEKLGIGFEEWRFFEYKSALEPLVRENMSAADRRQWQTLLDDLYDLVREEICAARGFTLEDFDRLVDEEILFLPDAALEHGLVDRLGRWDQVEHLLEELEGQKRDLVQADDYPAFVDPTWGPRPRIAVVYALGLCAMDYGIRARQLVRDLAEVGDDSSVKAVVLRVDSPGGDHLASDLVAEAVQRCREKKPVIVSQGYVAASGGYWISIYGDAIVAAPGTVTGSIGVIGGWIYDQGLKKRLGVTTDHVQVGEHADLGFGMTLPFLGLSLPDRNLRPDERDKMEHAIRTLYDDFVTKVAQSRGRTAAEIEAVAQGRVWSGRRALEHGLVDRLGGLDAALGLAREKAGLPAEQPVQLVEYPRQPLLDPDFFRSGLLLQRHRDLLEHLQFRLDHNGQPLLLLPADELSAFHFEP